MADDRQQIIDEFGEPVNMSPSELEGWQMSQIFSATRGSRTEL